MEASDLYKKILGIELPWLISSIEIDDRTHHVTVVLGHAAFSKFACSAFQMLYIAVE